MRPVVTDVARSVVCLGTRVSCAKTDEPIEMLFGGGQTLAGPRNRVLDGLRIEAT